MVKEYEDYVDKVQEQFPFLSKSAIKKILNIGLKRLSWVNTQHGAVIFKNNVEEVMTAFLGTLRVNALDQWKTWVTGWRMKERIMFKLKKKKWDGYYYIGLTDAQHEQIMRQSGKSKHFKKIYPTKLKAELHHLKWVTHIWKIPWVEDCGWKFYLEKLKTDKAEYIGENYYVDYHQCFLRGVKLRQPSPGSETNQPN